MLHEFADAYVPRTFRDLYAEGYAIGAETSAFLAEDDVAGVDMGPHQRAHLHRLLAVLSWLNANKPVVEGDVAAEAAAPMLALARRVMAEKGVDVDPARVPARYRDLVERSAVLLARVRRLDAFVLSNAPTSVRPR